MGNSIYSYIYVFMLHLNLCFKTLKYISRSFYFRRIPTGLNRWERDFVILDQSKYFRNGIGYWWLKEYRNWWILFARVKNFAGPTWIPMCLNVFFIFLGGGIVLKIGLSLIGTPEVPFLVLKKNSQNSKNDPSLV